VSSYGGTVHFSASDASTGVALPPDASLTGGQGTFPVTLMAPGSQTITVTDTAAATITGVVTVNVSAGVRSLDASAPATATAGQAFTVTVTAKDADGKPFPGYTGTVHFISSDTSPGVVLPADSTLTDGQGTFSATLMKAGSQTITAADVANHLSSTVTITVSTPAATLGGLEIAAPAAATAGERFTVTITARGTDGNPFPAYNGTVHLTASDASSGVVLPPDSTLTNGQGTFSVTLVRAGLQTVTATDAANALTTSATMTIGAAPASRLKVSAGASTTAGAGFPVTVRAQDPFGNTDAAYNGRVHFSSTDATSGVVLPADSTLVNGQGTFQATLVRAGSQTISVVDTVTATIGGSVSVTVRAAAASTLTLAASTSTPTAGAAVSLSVRAKDPFGNIDPAYAGRVHFTGTDTASGAALPADSTLVNGQGTFEATLVRAGSQTINAVDVGNPSVLGKVTVTVRPAQAATLTLTAPGSTTAGQSFTIKVTVLDRFGNRATGYRGTVRFSTSDISPLAALPPSYTFTAGDAAVHSFSATLWTPPSQTIAVVDTADASLTATSRVTVNVGLPIGL
jgi:protocatechuate 3,4-dioxygenase beta subunit